MSLVTFASIQNNPEIRTYIKRADETLITLGFTEHSFAHVTKTAQTARDILEALHYEPRLLELTQIAGFMHV